jgi:transcriptional regulator with XRE-family HTH domain
MSKSLKVSHDCIKKVNIALTRNGYPNQRALAHDTGLSLATISNFLTGKPVSYATFEELCRRLNLDWQEITTSAEVIFPPPPHTHKYAKKNKFKSILRLGNCN